MRQLAKAIYLTALWERRQYLPVSIVLQKDGRYWVIAWCNRQWRWRNEAA